MTRTEFVMLVEQAATSSEARVALTDWWRDEGERNAGAARELEYARDARATAEERAAELENARDTAEEYLEALEEARPEMICVVCLHDIRGPYVCVTCAKAT